MIKISPEVRRKHMLRKPTKCYQGSLRKGNCPSKEEQLSQTKDDSKMVTFSFYLYSKKRNDKLCFSSENNVFMEQLVGLIDTLPKIEGGNITALLCNTPQLRDVLIEFEKKYEGTEPRVRRVMKYVEKLDENEYFFYLDERAPLINHICCISELSMLPNMKRRSEMHNVILLRYGKLFYSFECYGYGYNGIKMSVGDNKAHPCRFCGRNSKEVSFRKLAHAIPEALGNDLLFCNEECGECNERLASVEDNLTAFLDVNRVLTGIKTKKGEIPEVEGSNFVIRRKEYGYGIYAKGTESIEDIIKNGIRLNHRKTITNEGIYKALSKMVIDLVPSEKMSHFINTVKWINGNVASRDLPSVYWRYSEPIIQPALFIFLNEQNKPDTPYCTCVLFVCNVVFMYVVPFVDIDQGQYKKDEMLQKHWPQFLKTIGGEWTKWNLADDMPAKPYIDFDVKDDSIIKPSEPSTADIFEIHHRPVKRESVKFPDIDIEKLFSQQPQFEKIFFKIENRIDSPLLPQTELSFGMGCDFVIFYDENRCETYTEVSISNSEDTVTYVTMKWKSVFMFNDITTNIELTEDSFSFDFELSKILWQSTLFLGERNFHQEMAASDFKQTKLTFLFDGHRTQFINYVVIKDGKEILRCRDKDLHM